MRDNFFNKCLHLLVVFGLILGSATLLAAQNYVGNPGTKAGLLKQIKTRDVAVDIIVMLVKQHGVNFKLTPDVEQEFVAVKAHRTIINAIRDNYRAPAAAVAKTTPANTPKQTTRGSSDNPPQSENTDERYEQLNDQAQQFVNRFYANPGQQAGSLAQSVRNIANQQINLNPNRFEGYRLAAFSLILTGNFNEAEKYGQMAIDRGGSLKFGVMHAVPGNAHLDILHVAKGFISIENLDGKYNPFYNREVTGFQVYPTPINFQGMNVAGFSITTYKNNTPLKYDFAPVTTNSIAEADLIKRLVQANINR
jgi:hypothetical protein